MSIDDIRAEVINHPTNKQLTDKGVFPVFSGSKHSNIVIIGQTPGRVAQENQKPWSDVSGDTLREWLGVTKEEFYDEDVFALVPMDFYYPGKGLHGDLPPRKDFAERWHHKIFNQMPKLQLKVLAGQYSTKYYLGDDMKRNLTETVKSYDSYLPEYFPIIHPSPLNIRWRSKNPWFEAAVVPELQNKVKAVLSSK